MFVPPNPASLEVRKSELTLFDIVKEFGKLGLRGVEG
jgi:hypothetical protein